MKHFYLIICTIGVLTLFCYTHPCRKGVILTNRCQYSFFRAGFFVYAGVLADEVCFSLKGKSEMNDETMKLSNVDVSKFDNPVLRSLVRSIVQDTVSMAGCYLDCSCDGTHKDHRDSCTANAWGH